MVFQFGITQFDDLAVVQGDFFDLFAVDISSQCAEIPQSEVVSIAGQHGMLWSDVGIWQHDFRLQSRAADHDGWKALAQELVEHELSTFELAVPHGQPDFVERPDDQCDKHADQQARMIIPKALLAAVLLILLRSTSSSKPPKQPPSKPPTALFQTCEPLR